MRLPTDRQVRQQLDRLGLSKTRRTVLERKILEVLRRDRTGTLGGDGYPAGGDSTRSGGHSDPVGDLVTSRHDKRPPVDPVHVIAIKLATRLEQMARLSDGIDAALDDYLAITTELPAVEQHCRWHADAGHTVTAGLIHGTVGGRLTDSVDLCERCYDWARRYLPDRPEYDAHGNLRRRVADSRSTVGTGGAFAWQAPR